MDLDDEFPPAVSDQVIEVRSELEGALLGFLPAPSAVRGGHVLYPMRPRPVRSVAGLRVLVLPSRRDVVALRVRPWWTPNGDRWVIQVGLAEYPQLFHLAGWIHV